MAKRWLALLMVGLALGAGQSAAFEWKHGWGQGVSEYSVSDGNQSELYISCPNYDGYVSAYATIQGQEFSSKESGFDVIVDGELYNNPFNTECRVCSDIFRSFWEDLRRANRLAIAINGLYANLPVHGIADALPALEAPEYTCHTEW